MWVPEGCASSNLGPRVPRNPAPPFAVSRARRSFFERAGSHRSTLREPARSKNDLLAREEARREAGFPGTRGPSGREAHPSGAHTASPRPLARTTRTRNETKPISRSGGKTLGSTHTPQPPTYTPQYTRHVHLDPSGSIGFLTSSIRTLKGRDAPLGRRPPPPPASSEGEGPPGAPVGGGPGPRRGAGGRGRRLARVLRRLPIHAGTCQFPCTRVSSADERAPM